MMHIINIWSVARTGLAGLHTVSHELWRMLPHDSVLDAKAGFTIDACAQSLEYKQTHKSLNFIHPGKQHKLHSNASSISPSLLTRMSILPALLTICATAALMLSELHTSRCISSTPGSPPSACMLCTRRAVANTRHPCA